MFEPTHASRAADVRDARWLARGAEVARRLSRRGGEGGGRTAWPPRAAIALRRLDERFLAPLGQMPSGGGREQRRPPRAERANASDHEEREDGVELGHFDLPRRRRNGTHAWSARARVRRSARHQHECGSPTFKRVPAAAGSAIVGYFSRSGAPARTASTRSRRRARARRHELRALRSGLLPSRRSVRPARGGCRKVTDTPAQENVLQERRKTRN